MKKIVVSIALIMTLLVVGAGMWLQKTPPLEHGAFSTNSDRTSIIIELGNKGFRDIQLTDVLINNNEEPTDVKMQINNAEQGFVLVDTFHSPEAKDVHFMSLKDGHIKKGMIEEQLNAKESMNVYGLSIMNKQPIASVEIHYRYLGMSYAVELDTDEL